MRNVTPEQVAMAEQHRRGELPGRRRGGVRGRGLPEDLRADVPDERRDPALRRPAGPAHQEVAQSAVPRRVGQAAGGGGLGLFTQLPIIGILGSSYRQSCIYSPPRASRIACEGLHAA
jgi:hypothetical protein